MLTSTEAEYKGILYLLKSFFILILKAQKAKALQLLNSNDGKDRVEDTEGEETPIIPLEQQKMQKISDALSRLTYLVSVPFKGFNAELGTLRNCCLFDLIFR
jgi:hypothetical protein